MAKNNYLHIDAVGQINPTACWAACLKWWLKAAHSINKSQTSILKKYDYLTDETGRITYDGIEQLIVDNNMYIENHSVANTFTSDVIASLLKFGPIFTAFTETLAQKSHVNVIYGIEGSGNTAKLSVMEPQAIQINNDKWKGRHQKKNLSEFNRLGEVILGYK